MKVKRIEGNFGLSDTDFNACIDEILLQDSGSDLCQKEPDSDTNIVMTGQLLI